MPMSSTAKAQWQMQFCVLLWGFTTLIGKVITLRALPLVWWRMLFVVTALLLIPRVWRGLRAMPGKVMGAYAGIGVVVALHWLTLYGAVKMANASVAATCIAIAPIFMALMEPWIARRRFNPREALIGIGVVPGVALVVGGIPLDMRLGLVAGVASAAFAALFSSFNKRMVHHADPLTVTFIELGAGTLFLTMLAPILPHTGAAFPWPDVHDLAWLLILSLGCTLLPFALVLVALRHISAFTMQITTNLEPVYAIIFAIILLGEQRQLGVMFYCGVVIVLASVVANALFSPRTPKLPAAETLATSESASLE